MGNAGAVRIDRGLNRPVSNELSTNVERELTTGLSARVSYVYKNMRDVWGESDTIRAGSFTVPYTITDPGPDGVLGTGDEQTLAAQTSGTPMGAASVAASSSDSAGSEVPRSSIGTTGARGDVAAQAGASRSWSVASSPVDSGLGSGHDAGAGSRTGSGRRGASGIDTSTGASASPAAPVDGGAGSGVGRRIG